MIDGTTVTQWTVTELSFEASEQHAWNEFPLQVTFRNGDTELVLDGYWDGGNTWRVRFAPTLPGRWDWQASEGDPGNGRSGHLASETPSAPQIASNPNYRGHIRVNRNGNRPNRHYEYADGTPFFWIGDTNWPINTVRCGLNPMRADQTQGPFYEYVAKRKAQGFTVIQVSFWRSYKKGPQCNEAGYPFPNNTYADGVPQDNGDFSVLNRDYFDGLDTRMAHLWEQGFVVAGPPNWIGTHVRISFEDAVNLHRYLLARYGAYNVSWALSGEFGRVFEDAETGEGWWSLAPFQELGRSVAEFNPYGHPLSIHPGGRLLDAGPDSKWRQRSSSIEMHDETWLDNNWIQIGTGQCGTSVASDYALDPTKPVLLAETNYEGASPHGAKFRDSNTIDADIVRHSAWAAFMNGAAGYTYGSHGIWQFFDPHDATGDTRRLDDSVPAWWTALDREGARQMIVLKDFFTALDWPSLEPRADRLEVSGKAEERERICPAPACLAGDELAVVYVPAGNAAVPIAIAGLQAGAAHKTRWFDPRSGDWTDIETRVTPTDDGTWQLPERPDNNDWVLLVQGA